eukprot:1750660-Prymnesium_polylepis.1
MRRPVLPAGIWSVGAGGGILGRRDPNEPEDHREFEDCCERGREEEPGAATLIGARSKFARSDKPGGRPSAPLPAPICIFRAGS